MKFKVAKSSFLQGLHAVQNVVGVRSTLPILSNVLLTAEKDTLCLTTTDLDISVRCSIKADVARTGATTLGVRRLSSIVREMPESLIDVSVDEKNTATLDCESSHFKIIGISEDEFPPVPPAEGGQTYRIEQGVFKDMLRKTHYAASTDETRLVLNGVLLSIKGGRLVVVATDGRRLALVENEVELPGEAQGEYILPTKAVGELMHTLEDEGELKIHTGEKRVWFEFDEVLLTSKLVEGTYPNYRQVIPVECEQRIPVEREALLTALRRVSLLASEKSCSAKLTFGKNQLVVSTQTPDVGEARESIAIKYGGDAVAIAFNPEFMIDPLKNLDNDEIYVELSDELSPGVIKCDVPFLYVLMPMRIG